MKRALHTSLAILLLAFATPLFATVESGRFCEDLKITIWNNSTAPHSNNYTGGPTERTENSIGTITQAELLIYKAKGENKSDKAVVICPGGGYSILSMMNAGQRVGEWFAENGITAAVVVYRLPNGVKEVPSEDVVEAMKIMRRRSAEFGFDPAKLGVVGFSAGGHLAATVSTLPAVEDRPNFSVLFYPVITSEKGLAHEGSFNNLLGKGRSAEESAAYSLERHINETTPPAILFHCSDDTTVPSVNSTLYYNALSKYRNDSALYIFPKGKHGWGTKDSFEYQSMWQTLLLDWITKLK
ncbi:MAG: alpha/beta hydrolase [Rikenellaceae bacterium]